MRLTIHYHVGQTLLETMVAIGVIITAVIGSTTLIISSITAGRVSQSRVEAANFAREGVEIVRGMRDGNWLKFQQNERVEMTNIIPAWNTGIGNTTVNTPMQKILTYTLNQWELTPCGLSNQPCNSGATGIYRVVDSGSGRIWFSQYNSVVACGSLSCTRTKYNRVIELTLKADDVNDDGDTTDSEDKYLLVESRVTWSDRTGAKTLSAQTRLYDWK